MKKPLHHVAIQLLLLLLCFSAGALKGQLAGVYAVPGSFTSIGAAIQELNVQGVSGPVTVNIAAGWTETTTPGGYTLFTVVGSSTLNTVTFQKSGSGNNPLIIANTGSNTPSSATQDGIWRMIGVDNLTINGIDLFDHNTSNPATMEFGYGFFKENAGNGCQNNQIRNCTITLNRINNALGSGPSVEGSIGIEVVNALSGAHTTALTPTTTAGSNSNNRFYNNVIQNVNTGISIQGFAAGAPFTFADFGNDIGGTSAATSNTIINFGGGGTNPASGINTTAQYNFNASYNVINSNFLNAGVLHNGIIRGILINTANGSNHAINNNTITVHGAGTTSTIFGINNAAGSSVLGNAVAINNNLITNCTYTSSTSGIFNAIINTATPSTLTINNNVISNFTIAGTAVHPVIAAGSVSITSISNNTITNGVFTGASGTARGITWTSPTNLTCNSNLVDGIAYTSTASTGGIDGMYGLSAAVNVTITSNVVRNLAVPSTGIINGIREFGSGVGTKFITNNAINSFSVSPGGLGGATMNGIYCSTGSITISGNNISALQSIGTNTAATGALYGVQVSGGAAVTVSRNKIFNIAANGSNPVVGGMLLSGGTTTVINNLIGSLNTPSAVAANPLLGLNVSGGTTHFIAYNTVFLNATSSGTLFGSTAMNFASVTPTVTLMNNIFNNSSTPAGTGIVAATRRNLNTNNLSVSSNANIYWAGTPSSNNLILIDPSNAIQTIAAYKGLFTTGTDANGCVNSKTVAVSTLTLPVLSITPPSATICSQSSLALNAAGAATYTWVNVQSNSTVIAVNPAASTQYTLMGTNPQGCVNSATMGVTTLSLPLVTISPSLATICPSVPITFTANGAQTFTWANSTQSTTAMFTPTANSQFSVTGTDGSGCKSSAIAIVLTYSVPQIAITPTTATICALDSVMVQASGADSYSWSTGVTTSSAIILPSVTTVYTVTGTESVNNCFNQATVEIVALPLPNLNLSVSDSAICLGSSASFTASGADAYSWSEGSFIDIITVSPTVTTVYTVTGTNNNGCSASLAYSLVVNPNPVITLTSTRNFSMCSGETISITASGGSTYSWQPVNQTGNTLTLSPTGTNFYTVVTTDNNNCTSLKQFVITVNRCTGLEESVQGLTQIYPNPSSGLFNIRFARTGQKEVLVFNAAGQLIKQLTTDVTDETFELNEFAKGIYHVVVKQLDQTETFKVIVQ